MESFISKVAPDAFPIKQAAPFEVKFATILELLNKTVEPFCISPIIFALLFPIILKKKEQF